MFLFCNIYILIELVEDVVSYVSNSGRGDSGRIALETIWQTLVGSVQTSAKSSHSPACSELLSITSVSSTPSSDASSIASFLSRPVPNGGIKSLTPILSFSLLPPQIVFCRRTIALQKWFANCLFNKSSLHFSYSLSRCKHISGKMTIRFSSRLSNQV